MVRVRAAEPDDMDQITALHISSWQTTYRGLISDTYLDHGIYSDLEHFWQQRFLHPKPGRHIWVAQDNQALCGFICFDIGNHPKWGTLIENLHISQCYQGRGLGKQLLGTAAALAYALCPDKGLYLEVLAGNLSARRFYQQLGAVNTQVQTWQAPDGSQVNELVFRWESFLPLLTEKNI